MEKQKIYCYQGKFMHFSVLRIQKSHNIIRRDVFNGQTLAPWNIKWPVLMLSGATCCHRVIETTIWPSNDHLTRHT